MGYICSSCGHKSSSASGGSVHILHQKIIFICKKIHQDMLVLSAGINLVQLLQVLVIIVLIKNILILLKKVMDMFVNFAAISQALHHLVPAPRVLMENMSIYRFSIQLIISRKKMIS